MATLSAGSPWGSPTPQPPMLREAAWRSSERSSPSAGPAALPTGLSASHPLPGPQAGCKQPGPLPRPAQADPPPLTWQGRWAGLRASEGLRSGDCEGAGRMEPRGWNPCGAPLPSSPNPARLPGRPAGGLHTGPAHGVPCWGPSDFQVGTLVPPAQLSQPGGPWSPMRVLTVHPGSQTSHRRGSAGQRLLGSERGGEGPPPSGTETWWPQGAGLRGKPEGARGEGPARGCSDGHRCHLGPNPEPVALPKKAMTTKPPELRVSSRPPPGRAPLTRPGPRPQDPSRQMEGAG